jgi:hypothetical protein
VRPVISGAGRRRVLQENKKYVHAYLEGFLLPEGDLPEEGRREIGYNPYTSDQFYYVVSSPEGEGGRHRGGGYYGSLGAVLEADRRVYVGELVGAALAGMAVEGDAGSENGIQLGTTS